MSTENAADAFSISELSLWDKEPKETPPTPTEEPAVEAPVKGEEETESTEPEENIETSEDPKEEEKENEEPLVEDKTSYGSLLDTLAQDDLIEFDDELEYDVNNIDTVKTLLSQTKEKAKLKGREEFLQELPEAAQQLVDILHKGGSIDDFVNMGQQVEFAQVPIENEDGEDITVNQELLLRDFYSQQGFAEDAINNQIEKFAEAGLLKDQARLAREFLATKQEQDNKALIVQREAQLKADQENEERLAAEFRENVLNTKEIKGFKVSNNQGFYDFITKPGADGKTAFQKADTEENKLLYAYMAYTGFDKAKLEKQVKSKEVRKLKRTLESNDTNVNRKGGGAKPQQNNIKSVLNFTI